MGSHYRVFVGPYVRCDVKTSPATREVNTCSDEDCRFRRQGGSIDKDASFCPKCGSPAELVTYEIEGRVRAEVSPGDVVEGGGGALTQFNAENAEDGVHLFVPNRHWPRKFVFECGGSDVGEIIADVVSLSVEETAWFKETFDGAIAFCRQTYGSDKVQVRWGVLGEWR